MPVRDWYRDDLVPRHARVSDARSVRRGLMLSTCPRKISATSLRSGTAAQLATFTGSPVMLRRIGSALARIPLVRPQPRAAFSELQSLSILPPPRPGNRARDGLLPGNFPTRDYRRGEGAADGAIANRAISQKYESPGEESAREICAEFKAQRVHFGGNGPDLYRGCFQMNGSDTLNAPRQPMNSKSRPLPR